VKGVCFVMPRILVSFVRMDINLQVQVDAHHVLKTVNFVNKTTYAYNALPNSSLTELPPPNVPMTAAPETTPTPSLKHVKPALQVAPSVHPKIHVPNVSTP
jgi:hypothetical protein